MKDEFKVHILNESGLEKARLLGEIFSKCLAEVNIVLGPGRELSLVVTKLQEACFFAKRGIAIQPFNQKDD